MKQQRSLFAAKDAPANVDEAYVRRHLDRLLTMARTAERLPWSKPETASWEKLFAELSEGVPGGDRLRTEFEAELKRLRASS